MARVAGLLGGRYAGEVAAAGGALAREEPFVLHVAAASAAASPTDEPRHVVLRGTIDLVVVWPNGDVDVLDYKSARGPDAAPYAFQLDVYAHAARARFGQVGRLRTGILFLGGDAGAPGMARAERRSRRRASSRHPRRRPRRSALARRVSAGRPHPSATSSTAASRLACFAPRDGSIA